MKIGHIGLPVKDIVKAKVFYDAVAAFIKDADGNNIEAVSRK